MQYRRLGRSGLQVSELSLGSWVNLGALALTPRLTPEILARIDKITQPLAG
jgi:hypothetical protein